MNPIIEGLMILAKYAPDDDFAAQDDQIWYGNYKELLPLLTPTDLARLEELKWLESDESWSHWV